MSRVWLIARGVLFCAAYFLCQPGVPAQSADQGGRSHLDVVVSDAAGKPVPGLQARDFTLSDDGTARQIAKFRAFDGVTAKAESPVQMIIVIDSVNYGCVEMGYARLGLENFLRENGGRLRQPTTVARLTTSGYQILSQPSTDGNA